MDYEQHIMVYTQKVRHAKLILKWAIFLGVSPESPERSSSVIK